MSTITDCPICMEEIDLIVNRVTTECGHTFHTKCLMTNASRNGFGCPYCRTSLAQDVPEEDSDNDDEYNPYFDDDDDEEESEIEADSLRSMRNMFLVAEGEQPEPVEESESESDDSDSDDSDIEIVINIEPREQTRPLTQSKPSPAFIARMLTASGVTMEDMVKCLIQETCHEEYADEDYQHESSVMFGKFRRIITRHQRGIETE